MDKGCGREDEEIDRFYLEDEGEEEDEDIAEEIESQFRGTGFSNLDIIQEKPDDENAEQSLSQ